MNAVVESRPVTPQPDNITSLIHALERAALNPRINVEKMRGLYEIQKEALALHAEVEFNAAMAVCQSEMPVVKRDAENEQTHSWYTRLETLNAAIVPIYTRHGFSLSFGEEDCQKEGYIRVKCWCSHRAGHTRLYRAEVPLDLAGIKGNVNKTPMHAFGSSFSYARRYITLPIFNVAMAGEDNDGNGRPVQQCITQQQLDELDAKGKAVGADKERFLEYLGVKALADLPASEFQKALQLLKDKERAMARQKNASQQGAQS